MSEDGRVSVRTADGVPYESPPGALVTSAHPLLLDDQRPWRRLLAECDAVQGIEQVSRRVHRGREGHDPEPCDPDPSRSRIVTGVLRDSYTARAGGLAVPAGRRTRGDAALSAWSSELMFVRHLAKSLAGRQLPFRIL
ncbi:DUF4132 domain-containing protein [Nonomuraea sp. NPDC051941]|uniref:DUF4132 domain-containing protein n=1 Tax=Nonomuraea sp. NPDC051941 TaxID=3364373 RepID=UPI0037C96B00